MNARWAVLGIFVLSGAAGLIYEIVWARQLVLVFGNTTQAVSAILTGFFGGMAIGAVVGGRIGDRVRSPLRLYGLIELVLVVDRPCHAADVQADRRALQRDLPDPRVHRRSSSHWCGSGWRSSPWRRPPC